MNIEDIAIVVVQWASIVVVIAIAVRLFKRLDQYLVTHLRDDTHGQHENKCDRDGDYS